MSSESEIDNFLMFHLQEVGDCIPEEVDRALAVAATLAARGVVIPEYLIEMYWVNLPCSRPILESATALAVQLGLLRIKCTCSSDDERVHCLNVKLVEYSTVDPDSELAEMMRREVAEYRNLMYT